MSREELLKRLEALNGGPLNEAVPPARDEKKVHSPEQEPSQSQMDAPPANPSSLRAEAGGTYRTSPTVRSAPAPPMVREDGEREYVLSGRYPGRPRPQRSAARSNSADDPPFIRIEEAAPGREMTSPAGGTYWLVERHVHEIAEWCSPVMDRAVLSLAAHTGRWIGVHLNLPRPPQLADFLFVDLETTGLNEEPLFLIGTLQWNDGSLIARQYLSRTVEEERHVISAFAAAADGYGAMVTFNGISFDGPFLKRRAKTTGVRLRCPGAHLDLLLPARQRYRGSLPNCKLQTLEYHLCGRERTGDIPGSEIPAAYHHFARTGNAAQIGSILQHNLLDLLTLVDLLDRVGPEVP
ncbi:MAG: ribonuclease H-like domain-containing protein [Armatimonadota bacterium]|nr:ribonuclease H-like domain-containing protein [Armatimonadota bacterium]